MNFSDNSGEKSIFGPLLVLKTDKPVDKWNSNVALKQFAIG